MRNSKKPETKIIEAIEDDIEDRRVVAVQSAIVTGAGFVAAAIVHAAETIAAAQSKSALVTRDFDEVWAEMQEYLTEPDEQ